MSRHDDWDTSMDTRETPVLNFSNGRLLLRTEPNILDQTFVPQHLDRMYSELHCLSAPTRRAPLSSIRHGLAELDRFLDTVHQ